MYNCYAYLAWQLYVFYAPLAQLDRALVYGTKGRAFESLTAHQKKSLALVAKLFLPKVFLPWGIY